MTPSLPSPAVRSIRPGDGVAVAALWRELWDAHENWGGYPGSRDARVYQQVAARLDEDARLRSGHPMLGRHAHLIADIGGGPCGQVEGWIDPLGVSPATPTTCEVRSLVVHADARRMGVGRALLDSLAAVARGRLGGASGVLAAEVLERNPARAFYARLGYAPVAWTARVAVGHRVAGCPPIVVRHAAPQDAPAIARLEAGLAARRRAAGDVRFDPPWAIDASLVQAIASQVSASASPSGRGPRSVVAVDGAGFVRAAATFSVQLLDPPFASVRRALLGRFALESSDSVAAVVEALVSFACQLAASQGALCLELADLSAPGTELYEAALASGATSWSSVVTRVV